MTAFMVGVPSLTWGRVVEGDKSARDELRRHLHGIKLYDHAFSCPTLYGQPTKMITLDEACQRGIVESVDIDNWFYRQEYRGG